ncbi:MAG: hypothetical protein K2W93_09665 [Burkholderiaceae bacterium]|nr:hypothetical protein [Burkholderiaceae bacterium]
MAAINVHLLPQGLRDLVRVLGEADAFRLVERRGGGRLVVPDRVHPEHPLMDELGLRVFAALVDAFGREVLELPKYDSVARQLRHERVRKHRAEGMTIDRIAVATGYTRRQVFNILADVAPEDAQLDMFATVDDEVDAMPISFAGSANDPFGLARK